MRRRQQSVLQQDRPKRLSAQMERLAEILRKGPQTIHELVTALGLDTPEKKDPVGIMRSYLSKLGHHVPITVHFRYGASTYEILDKKFRHPT